MKTKATTLTICIMLGMWALATGVPAGADEVLRYSCSNQIYAAYEHEKIEAFTASSGIKVDVQTASSGSCTYRLTTGNADIASSARKLYSRHEVYGYTETLFCKDPIAVIARKECGVDSLSQEQLQDIFAGDIKNWKELGGADLPVIIIVPDKDTAANKNFRRQVMKRKEINHDFMAYNSTMVIEAVKYFPCGAVSFISGGAAEHHPDLTTIKIDGLSPSDKNYPYFQEFYYVTRQDPPENVKKFIDFTFSEEGQKILVKYGMIPVPR